MKISQLVTSSVLLTIIILTANIVASEHTMSLILVEYGKDSEGEQTQSLVRYRFENGELTSRESLFTARTLDIRFDLGKTHLYQNRYIINPFGGVIDLNKRQVILDSEGEAIYLGKNFIIVEGSLHNLSALDFATKACRKIPQVDSSLFCGKALSSPNGQRIARYCNDGIRIQNLYGEGIRLENNFSSRGTVECSDLLTLSFIWIDDNHLLTQYKNGHLVIINSDGKEEPLLTIPDIDPPACGPEFRRDQDNQIYYETMDDAWLINIDKRTFEPYVWRGLGNEFDIEYQRDSEYGHRVRFRGNEIGRYWCNNERTAPGYIALAFGPLGSNLGYPEGVKVWSSDNNKWTLIDVEWLVDIVGWMEE